MKGEYLKLETVKTIAELLNENKELRQEVENLNTTISSNINSYNKLAKYSDELEDRLNKAVEYIEYMQSISENKNIYVSVYDLIKLLKRRNKE